MPATETTTAGQILTVNGGSSSIKFAVFTSQAEPQRVFSGQVERIGAPGSRLTASRDPSAQPDTRAVNAATFHEGVQTIVNYLRERLGSSAVGSIGHRIVHGGVHLLDNQRVTGDLIAELRRNQPLDLAHLPREIALLEGFAKAFPGIPQVACFDTAFHRNLPLVAQMLPIPRRYHNAGVRKFGFHGLSYTYLMSQLAVVAGAEAASGRVILAHLGSGASMAAVRGGQPIDTTMAFTPTSGLVMGTRPGDLDPGLMVYLMKDQKLSTEEMDRFISQQCGLLGVSETSSDMRDLLAARASDPRAAEAVDLFCYQAKKYLCALAAAMGGMETIVFAGGIGEHSPDARAAICRGLEFIGVKLDAGRNSRAQDVISASDSPVTVRIIATDEEIVIARVVRSLM
ncbi:MAG: acetate/propionate family kinase [Tepidisphaeraceae bacterium]|jgi:acetate kinase